MVVHVPGDATLTQVKWAIAAEINRTEVATSGRFVKSSDGDSSFSLYKDATRLTELPSKRLHYVGTALTRNVEDSESLTEVTEVSCIEDVELRQKPSPVGAREALLQVAPSVEKLKFQNLVDSKKAESTELKCLKGNDMLQSDGMLSENGPLRYKCAHGILFTKRSEDPSHPVILQLARPAGTHIYSTGLCWRGPKGALWAELDASKGEMGWMLVEGPGFGLSGPALVDASLTVGAVTVEVWNCGMSESTNIVVYQGLVERDVTVQQLKDIVCRATRLNPIMVCLCKDLPGRDPLGSGALLPASYMHEIHDDCTLDSFARGNHVKFFMVYVGNFEADYKQWGKQLGIKDEQPRTHDVDESKATYNPFDDLCSSSDSDDG